MAVPDSKKFNRTLSSSVQKICKYLSRTYWKQVFHFLPHCCIAYIHSTYVRLFIITDAVKKVLSMLQPVTSEVHITKMSNLFSL